MNAMAGSVDLDLSPQALPAVLEAAAEAVVPLTARAIEVVRARVAPEGKIDRARLDQEQHIAHGLAWIATYVETLRQTAAWATALAGEGRFGQVEADLTTLLFADYLADLRGGIAMNQGERIRPADLGLEDDVARALSGPAPRALMAAATQGPAHPCRPGGARRRGPGHGGGHRPRRDFRDGARHLPPLRAGPGHAPRP